VVYETPFFILMVCCVDRLEKEAVTAP